MAAFSVQKADGTPLNDLRYIKWVANFMVDDKIPFSKELRPCTQAEMKNFYTAENQSTQE